jgi:hypothetical protein
VRGLSSIFGLFSVIALLMLGAGGAWANEHAPMPCHDAAQAATGHETPAPDVPAKAPAKAMVMACCIACVSPTVVPPPVTRVGLPSLARSQPARVALPVGCSPSPEHGPPKA